MKLYLRLLLITTLVATPMIFFTASPVSAAVDTCTWTGATSGDMSDGTNWTGCDNGGVPETGDDLIFPSSGVTTFTINNDLVIIPDTVTVSDFNFDFTGNTLELSGSLNAFSSATFSSLVRFSNSSGQSGVSIQSGTPTFTSGVDLNVTGTGFARFFTSNSSFTLPTITGSTPNLYFFGNPTLPLEIYNTPAVAQTYTATNVTIQASGVNCLAADCLGDSANIINVGPGDIGGSQATLQLNAPALTFSNPIIFNDFGTGGPSRLEALQTATLTNNITVTTSSIFDVINTSTDLTLAGNIDVAAGQTLMFEGAGDPAFERIIQNGGVVSGLGNISVDDVRLELNGTNTYDGTTNILPGGVIQIFDANALGTTVGATTVQSGGALSSGSGVTYPENISLAGAGTTGWTGALNNDGVSPTFSGTLTLAGDTTVTNGTPATTVSLAGAIVGIGTLTITKSGVGGGYAMSGTSVNTYVGHTNIVGTTFLALKTGAGVSIPGDVSVTATPTDSSVFGVGGNATQIVDDSVITLTKNGLNLATFASDDAAEVIGTIVGDGHIEADGPGTGFTIGGGNKSGAFSGSFDNEDGDITKIGTGTWDLTGATFPGGPANPFAFAINGGKVLLGSDLSGIPITVGSGGTLKGTGAAGVVIVNSGGTLSTGNSPGCLTVATLTLNAGSVFTEEIDSAVACTGYDQTTVTGAANLGNASLGVVLGATPPTGTTFTILTAGSVTGTFNGLPDGATFSSGGTNFRINYTATTVVLTVEAPTAVAGPLPATGLGIGISLVAILALIGTGIFVVKLSRKRRQLLH